MKTRITMMTIALFLAVALAACGGSGAAALAGTRWQLVSIDGNPVLPGSAPTLRFDDAGQVSGSGGCNSFSGGYSVSGNTLSFDPLASTLMACADTAMMDQETAYLMALQGASDYTLSESGLSITGTNGVRLEFALLTE